MPKPTVRSPLRTPLLDAAIVLISSAMLMFQLLQTITLSLQTMEHNAFLVISLCLLGLGAGGSFATWWGAGAQRSREGLLYLSALLFAVTMIITGILLSQTVSLWALILLGVLPYIFVGLFLSFLFRYWPERTSRSYFLNLTGSGIGCLGLVWILNGSGDAGLTNLIIGALALVTALLLALGSSLIRQAIPVLLLGGLLVLAPQRSSWYAYPAAPEKGLGKLLDNPDIEAEIQWSKWGYVGRLDVVKPGAGIEALIPGGPAMANVLGQGVDASFLFASGGNWTKAIDFARNEPYRDVFVQNSRNTAPYVIQNNPAVLNIGFGGGVDIFLALQKGARSVVGVEINPLMIEAGRDRLTGYFDDFLNDPRVTIHEMDGRTFVRNTDETFDVVTLTAVDTGAMLYSNAHVLMENYLYTEEAFDDYFSVLSDTGVLYMARPSSQVIRLVATAVKALRHQGVEHPEDHVAILGKVLEGKHAWLSALVASQPLQGKDFVKLFEQYGDTDVERSGIRYLPGFPHNDTIFSEFFAAVKQGGEDQYLAGLPFDLAPVTDDRPFFYQFDRNLLNSPAGALFFRILLSVSVVAAALILLPLLRVRRSSRAGPGRGNVFGYFVSIGAGFMFIEIGLIQKLGMFLGHPSYSITVTLFSILVFSGLGSVTSKRLAPHVQRSPALLYLPIVAVAVFYGVGLTPLLGGLELPDLLPRMLVVALVLAPGSFFMGMPFPVMLGLLRGDAEALIPWAWAVNAFTSVAASVVTTMVAMQFGFTSVMFLGAAAYIAAGLLFRRRVRRGATEDAPAVATAPLPATS